MEVFTSICQRAKLHENALSFPEPENTENKTKDEVQIKMTEFFSPHHHTNVSIISIGITKPFYGV